MYKRRKSPTEVDPRMPPEIQVLEGLSKRAYFDYRNARFETFSSRSAAEAFRRDSWELPKRIKHDFSLCHATKNHFLRLVRVSLGELFAAPRGEKSLFSCLFMARVGY